MHRTSYDSDVTVWSPEGRLHQIEYAEQAVNQGTVCLGLRSNEYTVIAGIKRSPNALASHQNKLFQIDSHLGIGMAGITADARSLVKYMRSEALNHKYVFGQPIQASRLVLDVADLHQKYTQSGSRRPLGVGLLVGTYDQVISHTLMNE
jgi:20S proteasome subunit alpha 6